MTRRVARYKSLTKKYLNNIISIKLLLASILVTATILIFNIIGYTQTELYVIYFLLLVLIFNTFSAVFYSLFQAYEKLEYQSIANILNSLLMLIGIVIIIKYNSGLIILESLYALVGGLVLIYYLYVSTAKFEFPKPTLEIDLKFWKPTISTALQFGLIGVFATIYVWIDSVMLFFMVGIQAVGLYNAAYRIVLVLLFIPVAINAAIFPVMSKLYGSSDNSLHKIVEKYFKLMILIGIPIGVVVTFLANDIIILLFGNAFLASAIALQILIWATVFTFSNASYVQLFQSINRQMTVTKITFIGMVINIILNLILIPKYSYIAASFNTLLTESIVAILLIITASKLGFLYKKKVLNNLIRIIISGLIMATFLILFKELNLFILIISSTIIYLVAIFITKAIDKEDIEIIKRIRN